MSENPTEPALRWLTPRAFALMAVLWLLIMFCIYFFQLERWTFLVGAFDLGLATLTHLRFGGNFGGLMLGRALDLGVMTLFLASATLIGMVILRALKWDQELTLLNVLTALAIGVLLLGDAVLLLGLAGVMQPWVFWALVIVPGIAAAAYDRRLFQTLRRSRTTATERFGLFEKFLLVLAITAAVFNLIAAFTPEAEYDALEYHLGTPKEYILNCRISFLPHCFYASMPSLTEMLFTWAMVVRGDGAAKLFHWAFGVLSALAAYGIGSRFFSRRVGLWAAAIFYCVPMVTDLSMTARIDLAATFFVTVAAAQSVVFAQEQRRSALWLAATAAGTAFSTKYTAGPIVVLPLAIAVGVVVGRMEGLKNGMKAAALALLVTALVMSPWLIKNWAFTGNPVFPLLHSIFQSPQWDDARNAVFVGFHSPKFGWADLQRFKADCNGYFFDEVLATPLLAMLLPLGIFFRGWPRASRILIVWMSLAALAWFAFTFHPWRFVFVIYPVAAVLAAAVLSWLAMQRVVRLMVAIVVLTQTGIVAAWVMNDLRGRSAERIELSCVTHFTGQTSVDEFLGALGYAPIVWMNQNLPADAAVLYVGEARAYHARHKVLWNTTFDKSIVGGLVSAAKTADELRAVMRARGVTHIYWNHAETKRLMDHYGYLKHMNWELFREFLAKYAEEIAPEVYRLK